MNKRFRSAITGRWVKRLFAHQNPATTVSETVGDSNVISIGPMDWCPFCHKEIPVSSMVCPHCQSELEEGA